jgi:hypothetical protein
MRQSTRIATVVVFIAAVAVLFLAPIVPFSKTWYTATNQPDTFPTMSCSVPNNVSNPTLVYNGYESVMGYITGIGIVFYTGCYMPQ